MSVTGISPSSAEVTATSPTSLAGNEHQQLCMPYSLSPYVFSCSTRHGTVLLHLKRNRYYGLDNASVDYLAGIVNNWPKRQLGVRRAERVMPQGHLDAAALTRSLLVADILQAHLPHPCTIICSSVSLDGSLISIGDEIIEEASVRPSHVLTFLVGLLSAAIRLRFFPLEATVRRVSDRKAIAISQGYTFDVSRTAGLVNIFRRLRPYFFVADGHCLLHALALVHFLRSYGEFPSWVMGVRTGPWGAHSWVQSGEYLLDTNPEKVCSYEPILAV